MSLNLSLWQLKSCHGNVCLFLRLRVCMWRGWAPETEYVSLERLEPNWLVATCCDLPQGHKSINEAGIFQLLVSHLSHFCHPDSLYHMVEEEIWTLMLNSHRFFWSEIWGSKCVCVCACAFSMYTSNCGPIWWLKGRNDNNDNNHSASCVCVFVRVP